MRLLAVVIGPFAVGDARHKCAAFAMDLVVLDDGDPPTLAHEQTAGTTPFWTGAAFVSGAWIGADGCAP